MPNLFAANGLHIRGFRSRYKSGDFRGNRIAENIVATRFGKQETETDLNLCSSPENAPTCPIAIKIDGKYICQGGGQCER